MFNSLVLISSTYRSLTSRFIIIVFIIIIIIRISKINQMHHSLGIKNMPLAYISTYYSTFFRNHVVRNNQLSWSWEVNIYTDFIRGINLVLQFISIITPIANSSYSRIILIFPWNHFSKWWTSWEFSNSDRISIREILETVCHGFPSLFGFSIFCS